MVNIVASYLSGESIRYIAQQNDISAYFVKKELERQGIKLRKYQPKKLEDPIKWKTKQERNELIIDLYTNKKYGAHKIARILQIGKKTVFRVLRNNNCQIDKNRSNAKEIDVKLIHKLYYEDKKTLTQIAKYFGVSEGLISSRLPAENRISRSERLSIIKDRHKPKIIQQYDKGLSIYDLADEFEYHPEVIRRYLNKLNKIRSEADRRILAKQKLQNKTCFRSRPQKIVEEILDDLGVKYVREYSIGPWSYDLKIGNILIEVQDSYWHGFKDRLQRDDKR